MRKAISIRYSPRYRPAKGTTAVWAFRTNGRCCESLKTTDEEQVADQSISE